MPATQPSAPSPAQHHHKHEFFSNIIFAVNLVFIYRHFWMFLELILRVWRRNILQNDGAILEKGAIRTEDDHVCMTNHKPILSYSRQVPPCKDCHLHKPRRLHLLLGNLEAVQDHTVNGESDVWVDVVEEVTQNTVDQSILTKTIQLHAEPSHTVNVSSILYYYNPIYLQFV